MVKTMKNRDLENKIYSAIENCENPNPQILFSAKAEMKKPELAKRKPVFKYALAPILIAVIAVFVVLPVVLTVQQDRFVKTDYFSMQQYFCDNNIDLQALKKDDGEVDLDPSESFDIEKITASYFRRGKCKIVKCEDQIVAIEETYFAVSNGDEINISLQIVNDDLLAQEYYANFVDFENTSIKAGTEIKYSYDSNNHVGMGNFEYNGYSIYLSGKVSDEETFLLYFLWFVLLNNNN